jgi:hypothetical protein
MADDCAATTILRRASGCPKCGVELTAARNIAQPISPSPGDVSMCVHCMTFLRFDGQLSLRTLSVDEFKRLPRRNRATLRQMRRLHSQDRAARRYQ